MACNNLSTSQDNWLISPDISAVDNYMINTVNVIVDFTQDCNDTNCSEAFGLYIFNNNGAGDRLDTSNYVQVSTSLQTGVVITIPLTGIRFSLALRDNGTCTTVTRLRAYYSSCVGAVPYVTYPAEVPFGTNVTGTCVPNSMPSGGLSGTCTMDGAYELGSSCACDIGYSGVNDTSCTSMYN